MIVDVNVHLSRWPFRRLPHDVTPKLVEKLRAGGIRQAWAGSFDALLHEDIAAVNARVASECGRHGGGLLQPVGSVNPLLPDWQDDVRRCQDEHRMHAIRLYPNYHSYTLADPVCGKLFELAAERQLVVQIALKMEDIRTHHPLMQVPTVDPKPLAELVKRHPRLRVMILNNYGTIRGDEATRLVELGQVYFDISHAEQVGALEKLVREIPYERLLFGSHSPFFNLEAALLKFCESQLGGVMVAAIQHGNAERLLGSP